MKSTIYPPLNTEPGKHHPLTITLHWGTVICIVIAVAAVLLREIIEDKYWRQVLLESHRQMGLIIFFGVAVRLGVRLRFGMAKHMSGMPRLVRLAAVGAHWTLYALLVGLPLLGWAATNAHNLPVDFLGLIKLPSLVNDDGELADQLSDFHILGAWALLGLVVLHATAAFYHHYIRRDRVLWAMLPGSTDTEPERSSKTAPGDAGLFRL